MASDKLGAVALIVGGVAMTVMMSIHPSPEDFAVPAEQAREVANFSRGVHSFAIVTTAVLTFGYLRLTQFIAPARPAMSLGLIFFTVGAIAWILAAIMAGFVMSTLLPAIAGAEAERQAGLRSIAMLTGLFNMNFALLYLGMSSLAFITWGLVWRATNALGWAFRALAVLVGGAAIALLVAGFITNLDVHGWLGLMAAQSLVAVVAGVLLWTSRRD